MTRGRNHRCGGSVRDIGKQFGLRVHPFLLHQLRHGEQTLWGLSFSRERTVTDIAVRAAQVGVLVAPGAADGHATLRNAP